MLIRVRLKVWIWGEIFDEKEEGFCGLGIKFFLEY